MIQKAQDDTAFAIIKWVAGIAATVIAAVLVSYFIGEKKPAPPEHPGLQQYDDVLGRYSLKYPAFLGGAKQFSDGKGYLLVVFGNADYILTRKITDFRGITSYMVVQLIPRPLSSTTANDLAAELGKINSNMLKTTSNWFGKQKVISTRRNGLSFYIEKHLDPYWPYWPFDEEVARYFVQLARFERGYLVLAFADVNETEWRQYSGELRQSFESIKVISKDAPLP